MVKCRRVTIKKHGVQSYTVNLAGKAYHELGSRSKAKEYARLMKVSEARKCGKKVSKKEEKFAENY